MVPPTHKSVDGKSNDKIEPRVRRKTYDSYHLILLGLVYGTPLDILANS